MADQQVSPPETASIQLGLTSSLWPENNSTGPLRTPYAAEPLYNPPGSTNDAWNRVDRDSVIPVGAPPVLRTPTLPTMEILRPSRTVVDEAIMNLLNRPALSTFMYQSDPRIGEAYRRTFIQTQGPHPAVNLRPIIRIPPSIQSSLAIQHPPIVQDMQASSAAENPLPVRSPTLDQFTNIPSATVAPPVAPEHSTPEVHTTAAPNRLGSIPSFSAAFTTSPATLPQLPGAEQVVNGTSMQVQRSQTSTVSSATRTGSSPSNHIPPNPSPNTSPENSPLRGSGLPGSVNLNFTNASTAACPVLNNQQDTTSTTTLPPQNALPDLLVGRAELQPTGDLNGSIVHRAIESHKRKFDTPEIKQKQKQKSSKSSHEWDSDSDAKLNLLPPGFVRDPITGKIRKRRKMDDSTKCMRSRYRREWDELCGKEREDRDVIDGYEEGDSDLDFSDWEEAKKERRRTKKREVSE